MEKMVMARFKKVRNVNLPIIKVNAGKELFMTPTKAMYKGKKIDEVDKKTGEVIDKEPVDLLDIVDLESGQEGTIVVGKVLGEIITEEYGDGSYVGKSFSVLKHPKGDKRYHQYTVCEIELAEVDDDEEE